MRVSSFAFTLLLCLGLSATLSQDTDAAVNINTFASEASVTTQFDGSSDTSDDADAVVNTDSTAETPQAVDPRALEILGIGAEILPNAATVASFTKESYQGFLTTDQLGSTYFNGRRRVPIWWRRREKTHRMVPGDLNIRFSKIPFFGNYGAAVLPLKNENYPIRDELAVLMKYISTAESVITREDIELTRINYPKYIRRALPKPTFPNSDPNHEFWADFDGVIHAQVQRRNNADPSVLMTLPDLWQGLTLEEVAQAVDGEYPGLHQSNLLLEFYNQRVKIDYDILPFRSYDDFIGRDFRFALINVWTSNRIAPTNFKAKWTYGRPRPEEVAWLIKTGEIDQSSVPPHIYDIIQQWDLKDQFDFTAYKDTGSPRHPSWPAMHSAASSASLWMAVVFDLTDDQYCQALRTDYTVSYARTVAGVHYETDNIAGLNLGQHIVADHLASFLASMYGANKRKVKAKIKKFQFRWENFDPVTCSTGAN